MAGSKHHADQAEIEAELKASEHDKAIARLCEVIADYGLPIPVDFQKEFDGAKISGHLAARSPRTALSVVTWAVLLYRQPYRSWRRPRAEYRADALPAVRPVLVTARSGRAFLKPTSCWRPPAPHHPEQPFHDPSTKHPAERHKEPPHEPDQYRVCSDNCEHEQSPLIRLGGTNSNAPMAKLCRLKTVVRPADWPRRPRLATIRRNSVSLRFWLLRAM